MLRNTGRTQAARDTDPVDRAWQPLLQTGNACRKPAHVPGSRAGVGMEQLMSGREIFWVELKWSRELLD